MPSSHASATGRFSPWLALITLLAAMVLGGCQPAADPEARDPLASTGTDASDSPDTAAVSTDPASIAPGHYVGTAQCSGCHEAEHTAWLDSHHRHAMRAPYPESVLGDFDDAVFDAPDGELRFSREDESYLVTAPGPDGAPQTYPVAYTFGIEPLQQYLLPTSDGKLQALNIAWDSRPREAGGQRWMHLYPDEPIDHQDVLHWTAPSHNWNHMCADCHSTGIRKNYDPETRRFATRYDEITVGCEACHGPGSAHVAAMAQPAGTTGTQLISISAQQPQLNACAGCHSRRTQIAEGFTPAGHYLDYYLPALLTETLYHSDGQILDEVFEYGSFLQSRMHAEGVSCSDCHDPHSARLKLPGNATCTQCHNPAGRPGFPTLLQADYDTPAHHFHAKETEAGRCVSCHMPSRTYMQVDDRRDHSFRLPRPDLTLSIGTPNACGDCHTDKDPQWAADVISAHFGPQRRDHFGPAFAAARRAESAAELDLSALAASADQPAIVRATALSLMRPYDRGASASALRDGLRDPEPLVQLGAIAGSERWAPDVRWQHVNRLLDSPRKAVRIEAARVLLPAMNMLAPADRTRLQTGIDEYAQTLRLHADRAEAQSASAALQITLGNVPAAEAALLEALRINPQYVPALVNLADLYRATGRDTLGERLLQRAVELAPDSGDALRALALWLVRQQRIDAALPLLDRAWRVAPDDPAGAYIYAIALNSNSQPDAALKVLEATLAHHPDNRQLLETAASITRDSVERIPMGNGPVPTRPKEQADAK